MEDLIRQAREAQERDGRGKPGPGPAPLDRPSGTGQAAGQPHKAPPAIGQAAQRAALERQRVAEDQERLDAALQWARNVSQERQPAGPVDAALQWVTGLFQGDPVERLVEDIAERRKQAIYPGMPVEEYERVEGGFEQELNATLLLRAWESPNHRLEFGENSFVEVKPDGTLYTYDRASFGDDSYRVYEEWVLDDRTSVRRILTSAQQEAPDGTYGAWRDLSVEIEKSPVLCYIYNESTSYDAASRPGIALPPAQQGVRAAESELARELGEQYRARVSLAQQDLGRELAELRTKSRYLPDLAPVGGLQ